MSIDDEWPSLWDISPPDEVPLATTLERVARPSIERVGNDIRLSYAPIPGAQDWCANVYGTLVDISCVAVDASGSRTRYHMFFGPRALGLEPETHISSATVQHHVMPVRVTIDVR